MVELNEIIVTNIISSSFLGFDRSRDLKNKTTELIADCYWVVLGSDREIES